MKFRVFIALGATATGFLFGQAADCPVDPLAPGAEIEGSVAGDGCRFLDAFTGSSNASRIRQFRLDLAERSVITLELNSADFDPVLYLFADGQRLVGSNNNAAPDDLNSRLVANLPPGAYIVVAAARVPNTGGAFLLKARGEQPRQCPVAPLEAGASVEVAFQRSSSCRLLDLTSTTSTSETMVARFALEIPETGVANLTADGLEPTISIVNPAASRQVAPGRGHLVASLLPGPHQITVSSAAEGTMSFSAKLETLRPCEPRSLPLGEPFAAAFTESGCRLLDVFVPESDESLVHVYTLKVDEPSVATIEMGSPSIDSFIALTDAENRQIAANDDASGDTFDSRLLVNLPPGEYRLYATEYEPAAGDYTIQAGLTPPRDCAPADLPLNAAVEGTIPLHGCRVLDLVPFSSNPTAAQPYKLSVPDRRVGRIDLNLAGAGGSIALIDGNGVIAASRSTDADGNALIETTIPAGEYTVALTSAATPAPAFVARAALRDVPGCPEIEITAGNPVDGVIEASDCRYFEIVPFATPATRVRVHPFTIDARADLTLELESAEIEPALILLNANDRVLAIELDLDPATIRIQGTIAPGTYRAIVTGTFGSIGAYTLRLRTEPAEPAATSALSPPEGASDGLVSIRSVKAAANKPARR
ncbi:MAG: hypothetical protein R2729_06425 [Bryobacteraceae bacterium]